MKNVTALCTLFLIAVASRGSPVGQEHPGVAPNVPETTAHKLHEDLAADKKILLIDVRSPEEYAEGHVAGSINIPIEELSKKITEMKVSKDTVIVTLCNRGRRASRAAEELQKLGYKASSFCKLDSWKKEGFKLETEPKKPVTTSTIYKFTCSHFS